MTDAVALGHELANDEIRPFKVEIATSEIDDLRDRLRRTRWPDAEPVGTGWSRGVPLGYLQRLAGYWAEVFDWDHFATRLDRFPQFTTVIDGQPIHFLHVRSADPGALPLLLLHSWPWSPVEFERMIGPLTDPSGHGLPGAPSFDVVVPSLPGFGFSVPVAEAGWTTGRMARALAVLMSRLGYHRYGVHGGDIGAGVAFGVSSSAAERVVGVHVTTDPPTAVTFASWSGDPVENAALSAAEQARVAELRARSLDDEGYLRLQATRPQTIGYALSDSPAAQLAWIVEKVQAWTDSQAALPEDAVDLDQLLANVSVYWLTRSGASAAHALYESMHAQEWSEPGPAPVGYAVFGAESFVRALVDPDRRIEHWTESARGGHFPALECPDVLVDDVRAFFAGRT